MLKCLHSRHAIRNPFGVKLHLRLFIHEDVAPTNPRLQSLNLLAQLSIGVEKIPTDGATASPAIAPTVTTMSPAPNADALRPPRPADAGSGTASVVCYGVSNVGPATECNHVSFVRRGVNANQCMADENLARLKRGDHAVVDAPLRSQRQAIQ
jgi:hypothetical protein